MTTYFSKLIFGCRFTPRCSDAELCCWKTRGNLKDRVVFYSAGSIPTFFFGYFSFGPRVISGLKSIWPRWKFSISLAWSNGALLTGSGNRKSFRPSSSHALKGAAESRSEREDRGGEMEWSRRRKRGRWQVRKYWWETAAGRKKSRLNVKKIGETSLDWQEEEEYGILEEGGKQQGNLRLDERNQDTLGNKVKLKSGSKNKNSLQRNTKSSYSYS